MDVINEILPTPVAFSLVPEKQAFQVGNLTYIKADASTALCVTEGQPSGLTSFATDFPVRRYVGTLRLQSV